MSTTRKIAEQIVNRFIDYRDAFIRSHRSLSPNILMTDAIDRALQAERERAATIAESFGEDVHFENADVNDIAAAIREGKPQ